MEYPDKSPFHMPKNGKWLRIDLTTEAARSLAELVVHTFLTYGHGKIDDETRTAVHELHARLLGDQDAA